MTQDLSTKLRVSPLLKWKLCWRTMFIQAVWNYRGMQHIGLLWSMLPALEDLGERKREAMVRGVEFYNAHPFLCGFLTGAGVRLEHEGRGELLSRLKRAAVAPLGATGDRLFWLHLKPATGMICVTSLLLILLGFTVAGLTSCGIGVLAWNLPHCIVRCYALDRGLQQGGEVHRSIRSLHDSVWIHRAHVYHQFVTGLFLVLFPGVLVILLLADPYGTLSGIPLYADIVTLLLFCLTVFFVSLKLTVSRKAFPLLLWLSLIAVHVVPAWIARVFVQLELLLK